MEDYGKNKEWSYLQYWDVNNLYGWAMLQKLPVNNFEWMEDTSEFNEDFIKHYNEESCAGSFLEVDTQYLEILHELHNVLPFLPERMQIEKVDKTDNVIHIKKFKTSIESWISFEKSS